MADTNEQFLEAKIHEEYRSEVWSKLQQFQKESIFTDFEIICKDLTIPCHSLILASASPYFHTMITTTLSDTCTRKANFDQYDVHLMVEITNYFYTSQITLNSTKVKQVVDICEFLHLGPLKQLCAEFICKTVTPENCIDWIRHAKKYSLHTLISKCTSIMSQSFTEVSHGKQFLSLSQDELIDYLQFKNLKIDNRDEVLESCIRWLEHDPDVRLSQIYKILKVAGLATCTPECLRLCATAPYFRNIENIKDLFNDALMFNTLVSHSNYQPCGDSTSSTIIMGGITKRYVNKIQRVDKCWVISHGAKEWGELTTLPTRAEGIACAFCTTPTGIMMSGGHDGTTFLSQSFDFNVIDKKWIELCTMNQPRAYHASLFVSGCVYVIGGQGPDKCGQTVECYRNNRWRCKNSMPGEVCRPKAVDTGRSICIMPDTCRNAAHSRDIQVYNAAADTWEVKASLPDQTESVVGASAVLVKDSIFFVGGENTICMMYNLQNDNWIQLREPSQNMRHSCPFLADGKVFLLGGFDGTGDWTQPKDIIQVYDIECDAWNVAENKMPQTMGGLYTGKLCLTL